MLRNHVSTRLVLLALDWFCHRASRRTARAIGSADSRAKRLGKGIPRGLLSPNICPHQARGERCIFGRRCHASTQALRFPLLGYFRAEFQHQLGF